MQRWPDTFPEELKPALEKGSEMLFDFLHYVAPRTDDYDPIRLDWRGMKFQSVYVSIKGKYFCSRRAATSRSLLPPRGMCRPR